MTSNVEKEVYNALVRIKKIQDPPAHALLKEDFGIDSISLVRIITQLTKVLDVNILEFSDKDLVEVKTVNDLVALFSRKLL